MNQDVSEFDDRILARFRSGVSPMRIAGALHIRVADVRDRLAALGEDNGESRAAAAQSIWDMEEGERRIAIAKSVAKKAAEQLRRNNGRENPTHNYRIPELSVIPEIRNGVVQWTYNLRADVMRLLDDGYSLTEIGKAIGCSRNAINGLVTRTKAREAMRA